MPLYRIRQRPTHGEYVVRDVAVVEAETSAQAEDRHYEQLGYTPRETVIWAERMGLLARLWHWLTYAPPDNASSKACRRYSEEDEEIL